MCVFTSEGETLSLSAAFRAVKAQQTAADRSRQMPVDSRPNPPVAQSARRREARKSRGSADPALQIPAFRVWPDRGYGVDFLISVTCAETLWGKRHEKIARDIQLGVGTSFVGHRECGAGAQSASLAGRTLQSGHPARGCTSR